MEFLPCCGLSQTFCHVPFSGLGGGLASLWIHFTEKVPEMGICSHKQRKVCSGCCKQRCRDGPGASSAGKMDTSFIIPTGCAYPAVLLSCQNSPQKLAKIHLQTAAPACDTTTPAYLLPSPHQTMLVWGVGPSSSCHPLCTTALPWEGGRDLVVSCFSCWSPHSITVLLSNRAMQLPPPHDCRLKKHLKAWRLLWCGAHAPNQLGNPKLPGVSREKQILKLPKSQPSQGAAGWPKPRLTEVHPCTCQSSVTWLSLAHASPPNMKTWAKGCSLCCGSSRYFPIENKISFYVQKRKQ